MAFWKRKRSQKKVKVEIPYDEARLFFDSDYDRANPLTKAEAETALIMECIKLIDNVEDKKDLQAVLDEMTAESKLELTGGTFDNYVDENQDLQDCYDYQALVAGNYREHKKKSHKKYKRIQKQLMEQSLIKRNIENLEILPEDSGRKKERKRKSKKGKGENDSCQVMQDPLIHQGYIL